MSKRYNISWRRSDYSRISHTVKKVNQKIFEIQVKRPDIADFQPDMLDYQGVKSQIKTRQDLNRFLNKYKRYLKDGSEEVVKSSRGARDTKFEIENFNIAQRTENARRTRERKRLGEKEVTSRGEGTGAKRKEMGTIKENSLKPSRQKFDSKSQREWELAKKNMNAIFDSDVREERKERMRQNYIKGLRGLGFSEEIVNTVTSLNIDTFVDAVNTETEASFDFFYDPLEHKLKEDILIDLWSTIKQNESSD